MFTELPFPSWEATEVTGTMEPITALTVNMTSFFAVSSKPIFTTN